MKDDLEGFYPEYIKYVDSSVCVPDRTPFGNSTHNFSWLNPNYAYIKSERVTFQDIEFTLYNGDTMTKLYSIGGAGT